MKLNFIFIVHNLNFILLKSGTVFYECEFQTSDRDISCRKINMGQRLPITKLDLFRARLAVSNKTPATYLSVRNTLLQITGKLGPMKLIMKLGEFLFRPEIDCTDLDI